MLLLLLAGCLVTLPSLSLGATPRTLADLPLPAQATVSATLGKDQPAYHAKQDGAKLTFENPRHAFTATLTAEGLTLTQSGQSGHTVTLQLNGIGYGSPSQDVRHTAPLARANRVEYRRDSLTEWYVNGPLGLEQGVTLSAPPGPRTKGPLTLAFAIGGALTPRVEATKTAATFLARTGEPQLRYAGLTVTDATGAVLPASLTTDGQRLLIQVDDARARYPLTIDPFIQQATLTASDGAAGDDFGISVAISGDALVVGAWQASIGANLNQGAAYVFVKPVTGWADMTETAKLTAFDGAARDQLGVRVAISGDTVVVGAQTATIGATLNQGAAYVFVKPVTGWADMTETAKLTAFNGLKDDLFGSSVAISGDSNTIVVGADFATIDGKPQQGAAYVFVKPVTGWVSTTETAKLTASDGRASDIFGIAVAISGDTVVVGAFEATIGFTAEQGAAYVFVKPVGGWADMTQTAKLAASDGRGGDFFGISVAISGNTVVVGADGANIGATINQGAAYIFTGAGSVWTQRAKLTAAGAGAFGVSVAISGGTVVVGAHFTDIATNENQGAAYIFTGAGSVWTQQAELTAADGAAFDDFGASVAISADSNTVVAGALFADIGANFQQGAAYVFAGVNSTLTVTKAGSGTVTSSPAGINCGPTCVASFPSGSTVSLTAAPDPGSTFAGWSGDPDCTDGSVIMDVDRTCTATFTLTGPDLTGSWLSLRQQCKGAGATLECRLRGDVEVRNQGTQQTPTSSLLKFFLSTDQTLQTSGPGADTLLKEVTVGTIDPGRARRATLDTKLIGQSASGKFVIAVIDATNVIVETNETNNVIVSERVP